MPPRINNKRKFLPKNPKLLKRKLMINKKNLMLLTKTAKLLTRTSRSLLMTQKLRLKNLLMLSPKLRKPLKTMRRKPRPQLSLFQEVQRMLKRKKRKMMRKKHQQWVQPQELVPTQRRQPQVK